jgi:hypothetical protein
VRTPRRRPVGPLVAVLSLALAGCSASSGAAGGGTAGEVPAAPLAATSSAPAGDLSRAQLSALLLQPADLPDLPQRREFASAALSTQAPPQLALCRAAAPTAPHQLANVLASSGKAGAVQVFQVLSAYVDPAGAQAAYDRALADARGCRTYASQGRSFAVEDLADLAVPAGATAAQYRLTTPDVVGGDVRTLAVSGRYVVLVTGYGAPPQGQTLLGYQADVLRRALARLR